MSEKQSESEMMERVSSIQHTGKTLALNEEILYFVTIQNYAIFTVIMRGVTNNFFVLIPIGATNSFDISINSTVPFPVPTIISCFCKNKIFVTPPAYTSPSYVFVFFPLGTFE